MTANEKRAVALLKTLGLVADDGVYLRWMEAAIIVFEQEAERRGEERVLRWLRRQDFHGIVYNYKKWKLDLEYVLIDRRARGGKR